MEELRAEKINLPDEFVAGILIEKLLESWKNYKQQLKRKQKQLSLPDLITHIIIEDTNRKTNKIAQGKDITTKANLVETKPRNKRYDNSFKKPDYKPNSSNPTFKKKGHCFVCGKAGHHAAQCRKRAKESFEKNGNPPKPSANFVQGDDGDDNEIIAAMLSQVLLIFDIRKWVVDSGATKHICANKELYSSFEEGYDKIYLADSRTTKVQGK